MVLISFVFIDPREMYSSVKAKFKQLMEFKNKMSLLLFTYK